MHCIHCRITGSSRILPKPHYPPLIPMPAMTSTERRIGFCRITSHSMDDHHYVPQTLPDGNQVWARRGSAPCRVMSKSLSMDAHHYIPNYDHVQPPPLSHVEGCKITHKYRSMRDYRYVYPVLMLAADRHVDEVDLRELQFSLSYVHHLTKEYEYVTCGSYDLDDLKVQLGIVLDAAADNDADESVKTATCKDRLRMYVYSVCDELCSLVVPANLESVLRAARVDNIWLTADRCSIVLETAAGHVVTLPTGAVTSEVLHDALHEKLLMPGQAGGQHVVKLMDSLNAAPKLKRKRNSVKKSATKKRIGIVERPAETVATRPRFDQLGVVVGNGNGSSLASGRSDSSESLTSCSSTMSIDRDNDVMVASIVTVTGHAAADNSDCLSLNKRCILVRGQETNELRRIASDDWNFGPLLIHEEDVEEAAAVAPAGPPAKKPLLPDASDESGIETTYADRIESPSLSIDESPTRSYGRTSLTSLPSENNLDLERGSAMLAKCQEIGSEEATASEEDDEDASSTSVSSISSVCRSKRWLDFHPHHHGSSKMKSKLLSTRSFGGEAGQSADSETFTCGPSRSNVADELERSFRERYGRFTVDDGDDERLPTTATSALRPRTSSAVDRRFNSIDSLVTIVQLAGYTPGLRAKDIIEHYVVTTDYSPDETDVGSIALREGQLVEIVDQSKRSRWLVRTKASKYLSSRQGWVPVCYLEKKTSEERTLYPIKDEIDFRTDSKEQESARKRRSIVRELVETEEEFVKDMEHVVHTYLKEMDNSRMPKELRDQRDAIFLNFKEIYNFHNNVLIKGVQYYSGEPPKLGKTFLRLERDFDMHANYCQGEPQAQAVLANPEVKEYFEEYSKRIGEIDRSLSDHLKLPIQRINDYQLLLKELIKYSTALDENCDDLQRALDLMISIPRRAHDLQYINNIHGFKGNIHKLGRLLRHQDWFVVTDAEGRVKDRYLFLFKSRIFVTKVKNLSESRKTYILKDIIRLLDVEIEDIADEPDSFRLHYVDSSTHRRYPLVLKASSPDIKRAWLNDISEVANNISAVVTDPVEEEVEINKSKIQEVEGSPDICDELELDSELHIMDTETPPVDENKEVEVDSSEAVALRFRKPLKSSTFVCGETASMECELTSSVSPTSVAWLKDNVPLSKSDRLQFITKGNAQKLVITDVQSEDSGLYTCRGSNENGVVSCSSQLNVQGPGELRHDLPVSPSPKAPEFIIKFQDTDLPENTSVRFMFKVRASPEADIKFFKDGLSLKEDDRIKIIYEDNSTFEISIGHVTQDDAGVYSCTASNYLGETSSSAKVSISADKDVFHGLEEVPPKKRKVLKAGEQPVFKWFRDGQEMEANERFQVMFKDDEDTLALVFQHVKPEDAGLYTCVASTSSGRIACSAELTVQGMVNQFLRAPEAPTITAQLTDTEVSQGASAMLDLKVTGFPKPQISWIKDGVEVKAGGRFKFLREDEESISLVIKNVDYDDAGKYVVVARNELGEATTSGQLIVRAPPKFKKQLKDMAVMTDEPVRLEVEVEGQPIPDVTWYKDGQVIKENNRINVIKETEEVCALVIKKAIPEDAGSYSVVASNSSGKISEFGNLTVNDPPRFLKDMKNAEVREHEAIKFEVKVSGYPEPTVKWMKDGKIVTDDGKHIRIDKDDRVHTLTLVGVTRDDAGKFTCEINSESGSVTGHGDLTVFSSPQFVKKLADFVVHEGDSDFRMEVRVTGFPEPKIRWFIESLEIDESSHRKCKTVKEENSSYLIIKKVSEESGGSYSCKIVNEYGEESCQGTVTVLTKPRFEKTLEDLRVIEKEDVVYNVKIKGNPSPTVKWYKEKQEVNVSANVKISKPSEDGDCSLTLTKVTEDTAGEYECRATNSEGEAVTVSKLVVIKQQEVPQKHEPEEENVEATVYKRKPTERGTADVRDAVEETQAEKLSEEPRTSTFSEDKRVEENKFDEELQDKHLDEESDRLSVLPKMKPKRLKKMQSYSMSKCFATSSSRTYVISSRGAVKMQAEFSSEVVLEESDDSGTNLERKCEHRFEKLGDMDEGKFSIQEIESDYDDQLTAKSSIGGVNEGIVQEFSGPSEETGFFRKSSKSVGSSKDVTLSIVEVLDDDSPLHVAAEEDVELNVRKYVPLDKGDHKSGKDAPDIIVQKSEAPNDVAAKNRRNREQDPKLDKASWDADDTGLERARETPDVIEQTDGDSRPSNGAVDSSADRMTKVPSDVTDSEDVGPHRRHYDEPLSKESVPKSEPNKDDNEQKVEAVKIGKKSEEPSAHPKFEGKLKDVDVWNGEDATLEVIGTGIPTPDVKWYKDGEVLDEDKHIKFEDDGKVHRVHIKGSVPEDSGVYKCELSNELGTACEGGKLNIKTALEAKAPVVLHNLENTVVVEGHPVSFQAKIYATPDPEIKWFKDGKELTSGGRVSIAENEVKHACILNISNARPEDAGDYTLRASNEHGEVASDAVLDVQVCPIVDDIKDKKAMPESSVCFETKVTGNPLPTVLWKKESIVLVESGKVKIEFEKDTGVHKLHLKDVSPENSGEYACVAENEAGTCSAPFNLSVTTEAPHFIKGLHDLDVNVHQPVELEVQVYGLPMPIIKWFKGDEELIDAWKVKLSNESDRHFALKIDRFSEEDSGNYTCKAINSAGEAITQAKLTLKCSLPVFLKNLPKEVCVIAGEPFALECKLEAEPMPQIQWTKDGKEIEPDNDHVKTEILPDGTVRLSVENAQPNDKGKYLLSATNDAGKQDSSSRVAVEEVPKPPKFVKGLEDAVVSQGKKLVLEAIVSGHPQPSAKWMKDGKPVKLDSRTRFIEEKGGRLALEIDDVKPEDEGKYSLLISNLHGEVASDSNVTVPIVGKPAEFLVPLKSVEILEGLPCQLTAKVGGVPLPDVKWFKDGNLLPVDADKRLKSVVRPDGTVALLFDKALLGDGGRYTCEASNPSGSCTSEGDLSVTSRDVDGERQKAPSFVVPLHDVCVDEGKPFKLQAQIEGSPFPEIAWSKDGKPLKMGDNVSHYCDGDKVCLDVCKASPSEDVGKYRCNISNPTGKASSTADVNVNKLYSPPKFTQRFTDLSVTPGGDPHFVGRVSGFPKPDITWFFNGLPLHDSSRYKIKRDNDMCALQIKGSMPADCGKYMCKAVNDVGSDQCDAELDVHEAVPEKKERGEAPSFLKKLGNCSIMDSMPAKFTACVTGIPEPDFKWLKDGQDLLESDRVNAQVEPHGLLRLVIKNAQPSDAGRYTLKIKNPFGEAESTGELSFETFEERKPREKLPELTRPKDKGDSGLKGIDSDDSKKPKADDGVADHDLNKTWERPDDYLKSKKKDDDDGRERPQRDRRNDDDAEHDIRPKDVPNDDASNRKPKDRKSSDGGSPCDLNDDKSSDREPKRDKLGDVNGDLSMPDLDSKLRDQSDRHEKPSHVRDGDDGDRRAGPKDRHRLTYPNDSYDGPPSRNKYPTDDGRTNGSGPQNDDGRRPKFDKHDDRRKPRERNDCDYKNDYNGDGGHSRPQNLKNSYDRPRDKTDGLPRDRNYETEPRDRMADLNIDYDKFRRSAIPLALPDKPIISKMTDRRLTLSWKPSLPIGPSVPVTYIVDMCEVRVPPSDWFPARSGIRGCVCEIHNLEPFRDYKFRVRVENKYGISDPSPFATAYRTKLEMTPPKMHPKLPPQFDFRPETSPYFPKDYDVDRPLHDEYAHAPRFLRPHDDVQYGIKGQETNVEWWVYGYPTPDATFTFNGEPIETTGRYEYAVARNGQCKLYLNRMLDRDVGIYECIAKNEHGEARQRIRLEIAEHPHFIQHLEEESILMRKNGTMQCRVVGVPYPEIKWYKDWHPIVSSDRIKIEWKAPDLCTLTINGAISKDSGLYSCAARNIAGVATTSAMLYTEEEENDYRFLKYDHSRVVRAHPNPVEDRYDIGDELGRGTQSIVYHAVERATGNSYAAKTMYGGGKGASHIPGSPDIRAAMYSELDIMNQLHHRNLIRATDAYQTKNSLSIITELASGGELLDSICKQSHITESDVAHYIRQVLWGLDHMHGKGIAHLGLTIGDILLSRPGGDDIKICDFGLANRIFKGKDLYLDYGMPEYVAPEITNRRPVTFGTDMWSVGVITYLLLSGISPFLGENDRETIKRIQKGHLTFDADVFRCISDEAKDFISKLLVFDSSGRIDIKSALEHPWLKFADRLGSGEPLPTDRLRAYYDRYRKWMANSSCRRYYRRRPLLSALEDPSCMVYPPGEKYTPPDSPTVQRSARPTVDGKFGDRIEPHEHEDINYDLGYADSTSHYQNGPDTYLLQLRDVGLPMRLREYMRVSATASPSLALRLSDTINGKAVTIRERRRFTDVMDEEIEDEKHGELDGLRRRIHSEVSPRSETKNRIKELLPSTRENETAPYFREKLLDTALVDEQPAELSCMAIGIPEPVVTWYRNDVLMSETYRVRAVRDDHGRSILKFMPAKTQDAGVYKAVARNPAGQTICRARFRLGDTPGKCDAPAISQVSDTEALVTWNPPKFDGNSSIVCYALEYKEIEETDWHEVANNIGHMVMVVRGLRSNGKYQFRLRPLNGFGWGEYSGPSAIVETKAEGAEKVYISRALKYQQEQTERGVKIDVIRRRISLDYSIENEPIPLIEDIPPTDKYNFISEIARGRFSVVVKCCQRDDHNKLFAAKLLEYTDTSSQSSVMREYDKFKTLRHERIPCLYDAFHDTGARIVVLVQEKLSGCDILTYLTRGAEYSEDAVAKAITQVLDALEYLHFRNIVHLDIQPDNVVVSDLGSCHVKLVDFGSARHIDRYSPPKAQKVGMLEYMAPEILNEEDLSIHADVWGVGVLTYVLLSGVSPFTGENQAETAQNITYVRYRFEHLYKEVTPEATRFLMLIFKRTPQKRPTVDECLETSKWLNPSDLMLRKRERTMFPSNRLRQYAGDYHRQRQNVTTTSERLLSAFGTKYARSNSVEFDSMTTF